MDVPLNIPPAPPPTPDPMPPLRRRLNGTMIGLAIVVGFLGWAYWPASKPIDDPTEPPAIELIAPDRIEIGKLFTVTYRAGSVAEWLDPGLPDVTIHQGRDTLAAKTYSGSVGIVVAKPGTYSIGAAVIQNGVIVQRWQKLVVVGVSPIPPPCPDPIPVPPSPISSLQKILQSAYDAELDPTKAQQLAKLAANLATVVDANKATGKIKTEKDLQTAVKAGNDAAIGPNALPKVRATIGGYLVPILGTNPNAPADAPFWAVARDEYAAIALALKGLK